MHRFLLVFCWPWLLLGCQTTVQSNVCSVGELECAPGRLPECPCDQSADPQNGGSVVVRWRLADARTGELFGRGQCSCSDCPEPAWQVRCVRLVVTPKGNGASVGSIDSSNGPCLIAAPCGDAELATPFCLTAGDYDLQLQAAVVDVSADGGVPRCAGDARTTPAMRRTVVAGQVVNLDAVLLRIAVPAITPADMSFDLAMSTDM